ncbi:hypothetical protein GFL51_25185 [Rhizobium leguminosarum bv. viciae]|nr:hypothetical protein [Rhizobium leguminosarum bv. viciae]
MNVVGKTGFAGPLIRPTGTCAWVEPPVSTRPSDPRWGEEGIETLRHIPSAGLRGPKVGAGRRMRGCHRQSIRSR